jgi:hypothetical protein
VTDPVKQFDFAALQREIDLMKNRMHWLTEQLHDAIVNGNVGSATAEEDYKELQFMVNEYKRLPDSVRVVQNEAAVMLVQYQDKLNPKK